MWPLHQPRRRWPSRCGLLGCAGRWKKASKPPKERSDWTTTKCAVGRAGIGTSRWRCGRKRFCRWCEQNAGRRWRQKRGGRCRRTRAVWQRSKPTAGSGRPKLCRDSAPVLAVGGCGGAERADRSAVVVVAAVAPSVGALSPLSPASWERGRTEQSTGRGSAYGAGGGGLASA